MQWTGNIFLNARKIFYELPSLVVLSADLKESGWLLKVMAFIILWQQVLNQSKLYIEKDETVLLSALWHISGADHTVEIDKGFREVNAWQHRLEWQDADWDTYISWLEKLEKGRIILRVENEMKYVLKCNWRLFSQCKRENCRHFYFM